MMNDSHFSDDIRLPHCRKGVFSRSERSAAAAPVAAAEESGVVTSASDRRPAMGDKVTISAQPRNTDFLQPGQVGTVVEVDDMDAEDVWFTVEDADGETDEYCEADLVLAAAVGASQPPSAALAGSTGSAAVRGCLCVKGVSVICMRQGGSVVR